MSAFLQVPIPDPRSRYDYLASKNKAIIIPASGMDSVPRYVGALLPAHSSLLPTLRSDSVASDLSVYLSVRTAKRIFGPSTTLSWSRTGVDMGGNPSGGTLATMLAAVDGTIPKAAITAAQKPWALSPSAYRSRILTLYKHTLIIFSSQGQAIA